MRRGLSLFVSFAILATAGYFAWRLAFPAPPTAQKPVTTPDLASRPLEIKPDGKPVAAEPPKVVEEDGVPAAGDRIEGTVYDESGAVVAETDVQIIDPRYSATSTRPPDRRFENHVLATTVSGVDGRFSFPNLVPGEMKTLRASKPGFVTQTRPQIRVPKKVEFNLVVGAPVSGIVVSDTTGKPIGGVGVKGWFMTPNLEKGAKGFLWTEEVFTNPSGEFSFEGAPAGTVRFMLAHPEYTDLSEEKILSSQSKNSLSFRMKPGLSIEGRVVHATKGTPVARLEVGGKDANSLIVARWQTRTDEDGVFRMRGVRTGTVLFEIAGRGFTPAREPVELTDEHDFTGTNRGKRLEFKIQPSGRASGRVVTAKGEPVARARIFVAPVQGIFVVARDPAQHGGSMQDGETRTDEKGAFLIDDLVAAPHRIIADATGYAITASQGIVVGPDEIKEDVELVLNPAPAIRGTVTDEFRVPVANAVITVELPQFPDVWFPPGFDLGQKAQRTFITDESGRFRVEIPYSGKFTVRVDHPDFVLVDGATVTVKEFEAEVLQDFTLSQAFSISGTVSGAGGQGEAGAVVKAWRTPGAGEPIQVKTGPTGAYALSRLEAGLYRLNARKPEAHLTSPYKDEVPGGSAGIDFVLLPGGEIVGVVMNAAGVPVPEFQVSIRPVSDRSSVRSMDHKRSTAGLTERQEAVTDPGGIFRVQDVDPGRWSVQITSRDYAPSVPVEVTVAGGAPVSAGTIVLNTGGAVAGKIMEASGAPAEGVTISLTRIGDLPGQPGGASPPIPQKPGTGKSDRTGEYAVRGLIPGEYLLRVESERFVDPPQERLPVTEGATIDRSFTLRPAASVVLMVTDEVGEPAPSVAIIVVDADQKRIPAQSDGAGGGSTDRTGKVTLRKLPAGEEIFFRLVRPGFLVEVVPQKLREGDNGTVGLKIHRNP